MIKIYNEQSFIMLTHNCKHAQQRSIPSQEHVSTPHPPQDLSQHQFGNSDWSPQQLPSHTTQIELDLTETVSPTPSSKSKTLTVLDDTLHSSFISLCHF